MAKIKISNQLANVGGREGETILVTERLIIYVCGESRRKHGSSTRKKELFPIEEMCSLYKTWPHQGFHLMYCNYFVDRFRKRIIEGKRSPLRLQGSRERDKLVNHLASNDFNWWVASFVENGRPRRLPVQRQTFAICAKNKTRFINLIENEIASLGSITT